MHPHNCRGCIAGPCNGRGIQPAESGKGSQCHGLAVSRASGCLRANYLQERINHFSGIGCRTLKQLLKGEPPCRLIGVAKAHNQSIDTQRSEVRWLSRGSVGGVALPDHPPNAAAVPIAARMV